MELIPGGETRPKRGGGGESSCRLRLPFLTLGLLLAAISVLFSVLATLPPEATAQELPEIVILGEETVTEGGKTYFTLVHDRLDQPLKVSVTVSQEGNYVSSREIGRRTVTLELSPYHQTGIRIQTLDNNRDEANGSITIQINPGSGYRLAPETQYHSATVIVEDNDEPAIAIADPSVNLVSSAPVREGETATFTLTANPKPLSSVDVQVEVSQHGEYLLASQLGRQSVTIGSNGRGTLSVDIPDDEQDEPDGSITVNVVGGDGYSLGSRLSATVVVTDGGAPTPRVSIAAGPPIDEGGTARFTVTANPAPETSFYVDVAVAEHGDFHADKTGKHAVLIGTDGRGTLSVGTADDGLDEPDGSISVRLLAATDYVVATPNSATVRVRDRGAPVVSVRADASAAIEGDTAMFTLSASPKPIDSIEVEVRWQGTGDFFGGRQSLGESITIFSDGVATLPVYTYDDEVDERSGSVTVQVLSGQDYKVGWPSSATMRVNDDDVANTARTVSVSVADSEVRENARTTPRSLQFAISLDRPADGWVDVSYETRETPQAANSATRDQDYRHTRNAVYFRPGETGPKIAYVSVFDDEVEEAAETLELVLTRVLGPADIADGVATGTILPDPFDATRPTPQITIDVQPAVVEGQPFWYSLTAMPPPEDDLEVVIRVTEGCDADETYGSDFVALADEGERTVTYHGDASLIWRLPQGENYTRQAYSTGTLNDLVDEPDGPVCVEVVQPDDGRYLVGSPEREAVLVYDNDGTAPSMPELFIGDGNDGQGATEAGGVIRFDVTLSRPVPANSKVTVKYYTLPFANARADEDFEIVAGTLTFEAGEDYKEIEVPIIDDDLEEGVEWFVVRLWGAQGATVGDMFGVAFIEASD